MDRARFAACLPFIGGFLSNVLEGMAHDEPGQGMIGDWPQVGRLLAVGQQLAADRVDGQGHQVVRANDFKVNRRGIAGIGRRRGIAAADPVQSVREPTGGDLENSCLSLLFGRQRTNPCP